MKTYYFHGHYEYELPYFSQTINEASKVISDNIVLGDNENRSFSSSPTLITPMLGIIHTVCYIDMYI